MSGLNFRSLLFPAIFKFPWILNKNRQCAEILSFETKTHVIQVKFCAIVLEFLIKSKWYFKSEKNDFVWGVHWQQTQSIVCEGPSGSWIRKTSKGKKTPLLMQQTFFVFNFHKNVQKHLVIIKKCVSTSATVCYFWESLETDEGTLPNVWIFWGFFLLSFRRYS